MNIKPLVGLIVVGLFTLSVEAALIGSDQGSPGYSAKDILFQGNFSGDGVYWVDPDLVGGNDAVQVFADMSTDGGGWMLANDADNGLPALNSNAWTIDEYAVNQQAQIRIVDAGAGINAYFSGNYYQDLPGAGWTVLSGDISGLQSSSWAGLDMGIYDIYLRESTTLAYPPSSVPVPAAAWLFGSALIGLVGKKRLARR